MFHNASVPLRSFLLRTSIQLIRLGGQTIDQFPCINLLGNSKTGKSSLLDAVIRHGIPKTNEDYQALSELIRG